MLIQNCISLSYRSVKCLTEKSERIPKEIRTKLFYPKVTAEFLTLKVLMSQRPSLLLPDVMIPDFNTPRIMGSLTTWYIPTLKFTEYFSLIGFENSEGVLGKKKTHMTAMGNKNNMKISSG